MLQPPPAEPGAPVDEVDTPALLIDLDALEKNLDRMAALARKAGVKLRPHAKTHKSPVIARLQMSRGAVGQCVQKSRKPRSWPGGVGDILVSNEVAGPRKLARFAALSRISTAAICVDSEAGVAALEAAAEDAGLRLTALIEIDVGMDRCGIPPGPAVTALAQRIAASRWLACASGVCRPTRAERSISARPTNGAPASPAPSRPLAKRWPTLATSVSTAPSSAAPGPAPSPSKRQAASIPSCRSAPTFSWTQTTREIKKPRPLLNRRAGDRHEHAAPRPRGG